MNYLQISNLKAIVNKNKPTSKRHINEANTQALKNALLNTDWQPVLSDLNVDTSFDTFWRIFSTLFDEHFPIIHFRLNRNKHRINAFMNDDLLTERNIKLKLHKIYLNTRTQNDFKIKSLRTLSETVSGAISYYKQYGVSREVTHMRNKDEK